LVKGKRKGKWRRVKAEDRDIEIVFTGLKPGERVDSISLLRYNRISKYEHIPIAEADDFGWR
jgi:hypothetical protein